MLFLIELRPQMERPDGFEPSPSAVAEQCSSPLSYGRVRQRLGGADHQGVRALPARPSEMTGRAAKDERNA